MDTDFGYRSMPMVADEHYRRRELSPDWLMDIEMTLLGVEPAPGPTFFERLFKQ
jgi:hypothetical protein